MNNFLWNEVSRKLEITSSKKQLLKFQDSKFLKQLKYKVYIYLYLA